MSTANDLDDLDRLLLQSDDMPRWDARVATQSVRQHAQPESADTQLLRCPTEDIDCDALPAHGGSDPSYAVTQSHLVDASTPHDTALDRDHLVSNTATAVESDDSSLAQVPGQYTALVLLQRCGTFGKNVAVQSVYVLKEVGLAFRDLGAISGQKIKWVSLKFTRTFSEQWSAYQHHASVRAQAKQQAKSATLNAVQSSNQTLGSGHTHCELGSSSQATPFTSGPAAPHVPHSNRDGASFPSRSSAQFASEKSNDKGSGSRPAARISRHWRSMLSGLLLLSFTLYVGYKLGSTQQGSAETDHIGQATQESVLGDAVASKRPLDSDDFDGDLRSKPVPEKILSNLPSLKSLPKPVDEAAPQDSVRDDSDSQAKKKAKPKQVNDAQATSPPSTNSDSDKPGQLTLAQEEEGETQIQRSSAKSVAQALIPLLNASAPAPSPAKASSPRIEPVTDPQLRDAKVDARLVASSAMPQTKRYGWLGIASITKSGVVVISKSGQREIAPGAQMPDGSTLVSFDAKTGRVTTTGGAYRFE